MIMRRRDICLDMISSGIDFKFVSSVYRAAQNQPYISDLVYCWDEHEDDRVSIIKRLQSAISVSSSSDGMVQYEWVQDGMYYNTTEGDAEVYCFTTQSSSQWYWSVGTGMYNYGDKARSKEEAMLIAESEIGL